MFKCVCVRVQVQDKSFVNDRSLSLWRCLWHMSRSMMLLSGFCCFLASLLLFVPPICLDLIVTYCLRETHHVHNESLNSNSSVTDNTESVHLISIREYFTNGYVVSLICFWGSLLQALCVQHTYFISVREGIRCKCAIQVGIFGDVYSS
jgi:hypothetical protein